MNKFKFFESAIIGFLIGVIVSSYILFVASTERFVGEILYFVSLGNIFDMLPFEYKNSIVYNFIFYIIVYIIYAIIFNLLLSVGKKSKIVLTSMVFLLVIAIGFQQKKVFETPAQNESVATTEPLSLAASQKVKKYFGEEARGDLNNDQKEDIAFLIKRNEKDERNNMYYLSASLKNDEGYVGTNLLYVSENIEIKNISIIDKNIVVTYKDFSEEDELLQEKTYTAHVLDSVLEEVVLSDPKVQEEN